MVSERLWLRSLYVKDGVGISAVVYLGEVLDLV
jgi:hypothetical protein